MTEYYEVFENIPRNTNLFKTCFEKGIKSTAQLIEHVEEELKRKEEKDKNEPN